MSVPHLIESLAAGAVVVTPGNRLARDLAQRFDASRSAAGHKVWPAAQAVPWSLWLDRLWHVALGAGAGPGVALLGSGVTRELWHEVIGADRGRLMNPRGAARHAMEAWTVFHAWRAPHESLAAVLAHSTGDDHAAFATWAARYARRLDELGAIDAAQLPDVLAAAAASAATGSPRVILHGFLSMTPQQARLVDALRASAMSVETTDIDAPDSAVRHRTSAPTPAREIEQALDFARRRVELQPCARVAVVVANLHERRGEVAALADEMLCPELLLALPADPQRPYGLSLGAPLSSDPLVACAVVLLAVGNGRVDTGDAVAALRSPFLPDAETHWMQRSTAERRWRERARRDVGWPDVVAELARLDVSLHARFRAARPPTPEARLPRDWARAWSDWLAALGWPGTAALTSAQWQAHAAWSNAVATFAATGAVTGPQRASQALETLRTLLNETLFQPEAPPAAIQILGTLEAVGLAFDHAWLAGFDAQRWPPPLAPNPFLPLAWQRAHGLPRAHPEAALAEAQRLTNALGMIAPEVVASHAASLDDAPMAISPLMAGWPMLAAGGAERAWRVSASLPVAPFERLVDSVAPPIPAGTKVRGGARLFDSQSACPFQAFARFRLRAEAWNPCPDGLSPAERGTVLHAMLTAFWDDVRDHATLVSLSPAALEKRIDASVASGRTKLDSARWDALAPAVAEAESHRLATTLHAWLVDVESPRPPFVAEHEQAFETDIHGVVVRVRIDRIDALGSGGIAITDYKSGQVIAPARWFTPRPEGLQLAVYAHAVERAGRGPVRALAFAKLKAGDIDAVGVADAPDAWPVLSVAGVDARLPGDWDGVRTSLRTALAELAHEVRDGVARVTPRKPSTCTFCGLQPLCRIRVLDVDAPVDDADG